jgi:hypothetical protein
LVGVSAGTVASFSLIGWTFTRGLYDGGNGTVPLEFHPETVIIEAEETPEGAAGGDDELEGLVEPGTEPNVAASPAEPRAERVQDGDVDVPEAPVEVPTEERAEERAEESGPPQLVPVDEGEDPCDLDEAPVWPEAGEYVDPVLRLLDGEADGYGDAVLRLLSAAPEVDLGEASEADLDEAPEPDPALEIELDVEPGVELDVEPTFAPALDPGVEVDAEPLAPDQEPRLDPGVDLELEPDRDEGLELVLELEVLD